ncbi:uncharacterized protein LOC123508314 isoform X2 [Portunus trituberculatus]|uniref:uncharacterized protein LOC123508314 isoform X2 n=1 Tax=Portunus trituberculatus TaxID=210409 RepID=UPI001E1CCA57|nr:uncharacterized protein LOC123508314 isoform X2 [Portunus trituberculatus]
MIGRCHRGHFMHGDTTQPEQSTTCTGILGSWLPGQMFDCIRVEDSAFSRLRDIFNAALSAGYFPNGFKQAETRMIPKAGKPPTRPENYPSGPVTCYCPVTTLGVYPALLFIRRTVWSSGDPVPACCEGRSQLLMYCYY